MPIEKSYDPSATESKLYERWEKSGAFKADMNSKKIPYTIMMPPPNVTGSLHMGHALSYTIQDILVRYQRMKGKDVLWQPGTDHAGIATQMVVERQLAAQDSKLSRREMGREAFLKQVWQWKAESGGAITRQLRRLGASCDWSRERFTMDEGLSRAVTSEFVGLYKDGLIYKDKRLVNWDPKLQTAVSDLEVDQIEVKGHMWHFRYPLEKDPTKYICVATTRPETMLGDGAVAVNPSDERYKDLIGQYAVLPLANRRIPIIADEHANPEKGSGAVKITAAHDFNDFEVWQRHRDKDYFKKQQDGGLINLFDANARMNENAPEAFHGLDRYEARKKVIAHLGVLGLIEQIEDIKHSVPHSERSGVVIEPWLSEQWYCDAPKLGIEALKAVESGRTKFVPEQWANTYYAWMRDLQPWCISRQLWWGHQIPAWYGPDQKYFVAESEADAHLQAEKHYGKKVELKRDEDVFDTWFSSALWPFSTLGWPEQTAELKRYYPSDVLVTGFDIIFFWVARMMMMGLHFIEAEPFKTVYMHALVRDEKGQKMSKSKGNVIDPIGVIDKYGCDALRFTLATMSTPGRDIKLATQRIEGNRNFVTKLWNATRFCQMNECVWQDGFDPLKVTQTVNKWIVGDTAAIADKIAGLLDDFRFDLASSTAYDFVWNSFCDWYLEFTKPVLMGDDEAAKKETRATTAWVLGQILHLLHPLMPFITEELWGEFTGSQDMLIMAKWPIIQAPSQTKSAQDEMNWLIRGITAIRAVRAELNVPAGTQIPLQIKGASHESQARLERHEAIIMRLARLASMRHVDVVPKGSAQAILDETSLILPLAEIIDLDQERARLNKETEKWLAEIKKVEAKLGNKDFVDRAPPEVIEEHRQRKADAEATLAKLEAARKSLAG
jgi:valyl-tRNA synthetase